jgi:hypothetical protein
MGRNMRKKLTPLPKLIKKLDELWSLKIRQRDNKCILCGGYVNDIKHLQAHHWIVTRNQSSKYRWDLRNGVSLCYGCHIHQVHSNPSVELINRLKELCILNKIATPEDIEEIINNRHELFKINRIFLEDKINEYK